MDLQVSTEARSTQQELRGVRVGITNTAFRQINEIEVRLLSVSGSGENAAVLPAIREVPG